MIPPEYLLPFLVSNALALVLVVSAIGWPKVTRWLLAAMFFLAAGFNLYTGTAQPMAYMAYADTAILPIYRRFILGEFGQHITTFVSAVAIGQLLVGVLLTRNGLLRSLGTIGGIVFMIAILPLGIGSAAPAPLLLALALGLTERSLRSKYLLRRSDRMSARPV